MKLYDLPESVLFAVISAANNCKAPVQEPMRSALQILEVLALFVRTPLDGMDTLDSLYATEEALYNASSQEVAKGDLVPETDLQLAVVGAFIAAWRLWCEEQNSMLFGPNANWDLVDPLYRKTQLPTGKVEVVEDDTLALEDADDYADTPF